MAGWRSRITHALWQWRGVWLLIAIMLAFRSAIADWNQVPSGSMMPSILAGDRIVVDKLAYGLRIPFTLRRLARGRNRREATWSPSSRPLTDGCRSSASSDCPEIESPCGTTC